MNEQEIKYVGQLLLEAKKKKEKAEKLKYNPAPPAYGYAESLDFSAPLGAYNLYRSQGAVNWGPMTGPGPKIDDRVRVQSQAALVKESSWHAAERLLETFLKGS